MSSPGLDQTNTWKTRDVPGTWNLVDGSSIAVLGGGPAGSFFSFFALDLAQRAGVTLVVDIYERREFSAIGPAGCNMCGGLISESLVQTLAAEGIELPSSVVERGIDSYVMHTDESSVRIDTPIPEKRIASVHRGGGPRGPAGRRWGSFDKYLLDLAIGKGARLIRGKVEDVTIADGRPVLGTAESPPRSYDLLVVAAGVNTAVLNVIERLGLGYSSPKTTATYIAEFPMGAEAIQAALGSSMHVFLLNLPRLEFAAIVPKGDFVSFCLLGHGINDRFFHEFIRHPRVRACFPAGWEPPEVSCHCAPKMQVESARRLYSDRVVFIGDAGAGRLFKDGIGSAYKTAKAAAATAVFEGVSSKHFRKHFAPVCRRIQRDNMYGKIVFLVTREIQRRRFNRRGVVRMTAREQLDRRLSPRMSSVLWDTFTGSASYREIFGKTLHPVFVGRLLASVLAGFVFRKERLLPASKPAPPVSAYTYASAHTIEESHGQRIPGPGVRTRTDNLPAG